MSTEPPRSPEELRLDQALGEAIRRRRSNLKWSQERLADESAPMSKKTIGRIEKGTVSMKTPQMYRISNAFEISLGVLYQDARDLLDEGWRPSED
ncbi:helix-turn-helix domain-containing protein [Nocardia sp. NPDC003999]